MDVSISNSARLCGQLAAAHGIQRIAEAIALRGAANIILATGASQFEMLKALTRAAGVEWGRVTCFHLDEYVGLPGGAAHGASFARYLSERFVAALPAGQAPRAFYFINGTKSDGADDFSAESECARLAALLTDDVKIDVAFIGIGENGHLAFNDPPCNVDCTAPYLVVALDEACRRQQLGEGWFATLADVPTHAISMSMQQILKAAHIVCTVPDARKAAAVSAALAGPVTPAVPASYLQTHASVALFLDEPAARDLRRTTQQA